MLLTVLKHSMSAISSSYCCMMRIEAILRLPKTYRIRFDHANPIVLPCMIFLASKHAKEKSSGGKAMTERHTMIQYALETVARPGSREIRVRAAPDGQAIRNRRRTNA